MYHLDYAEFYITNVCNLNCHNCNRFNNFAFTNHFSWADHRDQYQQWANRLKISEISILGGEPMAHPKLFEWVDGISDLWPEASISIVTNGTYLDRWPDLYSKLTKYQGRVFLEISGHNWKKVREQLDSVSEWYPTAVNIHTKVDETEWKRRYDAARQYNWPDCDTIKQFYQTTSEFQSLCYENCIHPTQIFQTMFVDKNNVRVCFTPAIYFYPGPLVYEKNPIYIKLNDSDPKQALDNCFSKRCHTFLDGKLHKCPTVAILPKFIQQFPIDISDADKDLINAYQAADPQWSDSQMSEFMTNIIGQEMIDQCKFCPTQNTVNSVLESTTKKIKFFKKSDIEVDKI